ncbi:MAG TPA: hypothetical protein VFX97_00755 [Pyrinomonadaceae bacterium]|nr:hypothetical protein [Pyrinomonadaceae bacterium]
MKHFKVTHLLLSVLLLSAPSTSACTRETGEPGSSVQNYQWRRVIESGKGCFQESGCAPGQWAMALVPLAAFDKLFIIGWKEVWSSADGINWTSQPKTDWGERHGMVHVFFDNKMWMTGGMQSWDKFKNDVWYSTDGRDWKLAMPHAPWAPRRNHQLLVFDNKMWLIGGAMSSGRLDQTPTQFFNDVWSSTDGVNWTQVTARAAWDARDGLLAFSFGNRIWVIGGEGRRDVWSSADGKTWTQATAAAAWTARRGNGGLVFDGKMWIFGGLERNDVWYSTDGQTWQTAFAHAPWTTRSAEHSVVFNGKLWIYGGKTGRPDSWKESGDVWIMSAPPAR